MSHEPRSRRHPAHEREGSGAPAEPTARATDPIQLLRKYRAEPIPGLPEAVTRFHLKIVTDVLEGYDQSAASEGVVRATQAWHRHHEGFAASRPREINFDGAAKRLACDQGCNHCCRSPVGVVAAEAVHVADTVARTFTAHERGELEARMAERRAAPQVGPHRFALCPLNVDGKCMVYEARPYNCRVFHSFDAGACERLFVRGEMGRGLPVDPIRQRYDRLIAASATVAFTAIKLDMRMLDFMAALEVALKAGDSRCERLAAGEDLFAELPTITPPWETGPA